MMHDVRDLKVVAIYHDCTGLPSPPLHSPTRILTAFALCLATFGFSGIAVQDSSWNTRVLVCKFQSLVTSTFQQLFQRRFILGSCQCDSAGVVRLKATHDSSHKRLSHVHHA